VLSGPEAQVVAHAGAGDADQDDEREMESSLRGEVAAQHEHGLLGRGHPRIAQEDDDEDRPVADVLEELGQVRHGRPAREDITGG